MNWLQRVQAAYQIIVAGPVTAREKSAGLFRRSGAERRAYPRVRSYDLIKFSPGLMAEKMDDSEVLSRIYDISERGLRIFSPVPVHRDGDLQFRVNFMEGVREISGSGAVRWVRKSRRSQGRYQHVGISLSALDTDDRDAIRSWVQSREKIVDRRSTEPE